MLTLRTQEVRLGTRLLYPPGEIPSRSGFPCCAIGGIMGHAGSKLYPILASSKSQRRWTWFQN